ncbi:RICIN domain-containing protein [Kitasatospora sp. NPDC004799]|uniref:RICIN domain-containing protein n=1 Tax=Kitasatospora sp. NPDC004799 TaxID=3154460 RepID=UPI00339E3977
MPTPPSRGPRRPATRRPGPLRRLTALATTAVAGALLLTTAPAASAAPASASAPAPAPAPLADRGSDFACDPGYYRIKAAGGTNLYLTVALSSWNHGSVIQYQWEDQDNQKWQVCRKRQADGSERVVFRDGWRHWCMAVDRGFSDPGAWILTVGCDDDYVPDHQQFSMLKVSGTDLFALRIQSTQLWFSAQYNSNNGSQILQGSAPDLFSLELA